jgi:Tol biopolymer transport system component
MVISFRRPSPEPLVKEPTMSWTGRFCQLLRGASSRRNLSRRRANHRFRPKLEQLEGRLVPTIFLDSPRGANLNNFQIFAMNDDGSSFTNLNKDPLQDQHPAASPDGTKVLFDRDYGTPFIANKQIAVMNADGSNDVRLTNATGINDTQPAWSPDGGKIAFVRQQNADAKSQIYVMNADGSNVKLVSDGTANDTAPAWVNNNLIVFASDRSGNGDIYTVAATGGAPTNLTPNSPAAEGDPRAFTGPNGSKIVFERNVADPNNPLAQQQYQIMVMNADGSNVTNVSKNTFNDQVPTWSPDGTKIAFQSSRDGGGFEIFVMNADGSSPKRVGPDSGAGDLYDPSWATGGLAGAPAHTAYFTDGAGRIWKLTNGVGTQTTGFATRLSAGHDAAGNEQLYFTDGSNKLWVYTSAGQFISTGAFATRLAAANGRCYFTDGNNRIYVYNDATGAATDTTGYATRLAAGLDANNADQLYFTDGNNKIYRYTTAGKFTDMGIFGTRIAGGSGKVFLTDGNNQIWTASDLNAYTQTAAFGTQISVGADGNNNDQLYFTDGAGKLSLFKLGKANNTAAFAKNVAAGSSFLAFTDGSNKVWTSDDTGAFSQTAYAGVLLSVP